LITANTWKRCTILSHFQVDELIRRCDLDTDCSGTDEEHQGPFSVLRLAKVLPGIPNASTNTTQATTAAAAAGQEVSQDDWAAHRWEIELPELFFPDHTAYSSHMSAVDQGWRLTLPIAPVPKGGLGPEDAYLFQLYVNHVVPIMTPVHNLENPWLRYPAIAVQHCAMGQKYLLHAMMALAAVFHSNTGGVGGPSGDPAEMSRAGTELYLKAMAELRMCIDKGTVGYLGLLTTMLTFLLIEVSYCSPRKRIL
jgi:hypothetical protein